MTVEDKKQRQMPSNLPGAGEYDVGYGKPPAATRFKPGLSGNPRGRPRGAKNKLPALHEERMKSIILEEAYREIKVREGDRTVSVPVAQAVIRALAVNAAKGNHRAQQLFAELLATTERANKEFHDDWLKTAIDYKVNWERELAFRKANGIEGSEPLPHPDDIVIDMSNGGVIIKGPMTREEKVEWDEMRRKKAAFQQELVECRQELIDDPDHEHRDMIEGDIAYAERLLNLISRVIPN